MIKRKRRMIKVADHPPTWIETDSIDSDKKIIAAWQKKHCLKTKLSDNQYKREFNTVREGKLEQIRNYKR